MAAHRKLGAAQIAAICDRFQAGATLDQLAADYGVTTGAISYHLRQRGIRRTAPEPAPAGTLASLLAAVVPGEWVDDALCAQVDPELFFPEKGGSTREAKAVCARCPVRPECLEYALENTERYGIYGGTSERERRRLMAIDAQRRQDGAA